MEPGEGGGEGGVADRSVDGAKNAAVRKLWHELGIPAEELEEMRDGFKFLTPVNYWAADTVTHREKR